MNYFVKLDGAQFVLMSREDHADAAAEFMTADPTIEGLLRKAWMAHGLTLSIPLVQ